MKNNSILKTVIAATISLSALAPSTSKADDVASGLTICSSDVSMWDLSNAPPLFSTLYVVVTTIKTPVWEYPTVAIVYNPAEMRNAAIEAIELALEGLPAVADYCDAVKVTSTGVSTFYNNYPGAIKMNVSFPQIVIGLH